MLQQNLNNVTNFCRVWIVAHRKKEKQNYVLLIASTFWSVRSDINHSLNHSQNVK